MSESRQQQVHFKCISNFLNVQHPLREEDIQYHFTVKGSIAHHDLQIKYQSIEGDNEYKFLFCLSEDTCFDHLSIKIGDKVIDCVIKEKEEAKEEYKQAISQGKTAAFGQLADTRGFFTIDLGNIPPTQEFYINFKFIEQLSLQGQYYQMVLPFQAKSATRSFKNLDLVGDILTQTDQDEIVSTEFLNCYQNQTINFKKITNQHTQVTAKFSEFIVTSLNEDGFNIGYLKIRFDKEHVTLLSSFQNDSEISPYCALVNFVPHLISVKKSLFDFSKKQADLVKSEFILVLDRSGSMSGSRIQMAKESLTFFLKSLPVDSIYNVISFGSNYQMMYQQSVQFNDQNLQDSIAQIEDFSADMGGTNICKALSDLFQNLQDQYGLRKKIYILTDGEFNDYQEAMEIVKKNQQRCEINALCIGSDCNFQYAQSMVKQTGGCTQKVGKTSEIISKVIQLLTDSFQNYEGISMKLESDHDDCINYIVPNPQQIQYIDTTKTLRFYIFLNRKLEDVNQIKFKLTTKYKNDKSLENDWVIDIQQQVANEQAQVHKMGLYQLIRQLTINKQRKTENIFDDISSAIKLSQNQQIELFKNEAIRYQILCEYTAFIGQTKLGNQQDSLNDIKLNLLEQNVWRLKSQSSQINYSIQKANVCLSSATYYHKSSKKSSCCGGGGGGGDSYYRNSQPQNNQPIVLGNNDISTQKQSSGQTSYSQIILKQTAKGLWQYSQEIKNILQISGSLVDELNPIDKMVPDYQNIWITLIIIYWLKEYYSKFVNQHQYVLLKAIGITDRLKKQHDILDPENVLKKLFKDYKPQSV